MSVHRGPSGHAGTPLLPSGACDSHSHVYGPASAFPYRPDRIYDPVDAPYDAYRGHIGGLGLERSVFVQPAVYGSDHGALIDALRRSAGLSSGVGLVECDVAEVELDLLHHAGLRGARFNFMPHLGPAPLPPEMRSLARRLGAIGWHVCLHLDMTALRDQADLIASLDCPVVIDHMARISLDAPGLEADLAFIEDLLKAPNVWIKLSGADRAVRARTELPKMKPILARLHAAAPDRSLWGFDWPHPNVRWMPEDRDLLDLALDALSKPEAIRQVFVENPGRLYFSC